MFAAAITAAQHQEPLFMDNPVAAFGRNLFATPAFIADAAIDRSRGAALATARMLGAAKTPAHALAEAGLRANAAAGGALAHLMRNNVQVIDGLLDEGVRRLELMAEAVSLRTLVTEQVDLLAETRTRVNADARRTLAILVDARTAITEALTGALPTRGTPNDATPRVQRARTKKTASRKRPQKRATPASRRTR
jgi:hypothetical protein